MEVAATSPPGQLNNANSGPDSEISRRTTPLLFLSEVDPFPKVRLLPITWRLSSAPIA